jgi:hypothetical protein
MFEQFAAGNPHFRYEDRIVQDGEELSQLAARLATVHAPTAVIESLHRYVTETANLLAAFAAETRAWASSSGTPFKNNAPAV